jgi:hypothetical protein
MVACFEKKISETMEKTDISSLDNLSDVLLKINLCLHGSFVSPPDSVDKIQSSSGIDNLYILKVFYFILLNEVFFKECKVILIFFRYETISPYAYPTTSQRIIGKCKW